MTTTATSQHRGTDRDTAPGRVATAFPSASGAVLEPATQRFIDSLAGAPPLYRLTPEAARRLLAGRL